MHHVMSVGSWRVGEGCWAVNEGAVSRRGDYHLFSSSGASRSSDTLGAFIVQDVVLNLPLIVTSAAGLHLHLSEIRYLKCCSPHLCMATATMKYDKETEEQGMQKE